MTYVYPLYCLANKKEKEKKDLLALLEDFTKVGQSVSCDSQILAGDQEEQVWQRARADDALIRPGQDFISFIIKFAYKSVHFVVRSDFFFFLLKGKAIIQRKEFLNASLGN